MIYFNERSELLLSAGDFNFDVNCKMGKKGTKMFQLKVKQVTLSETTQLKNIGKFIQFRLMRLYEI